VAFDVVVLNGGSSSGKSAIGRALQQLLPEPWVVLGVDELLAALPPGPDSGARPSLIEFGEDGTVTVGEAFARVEDAWNAGLAAMAGAGLGVIVEDVFVGGARSQARLAAAFAHVRVLWVGVRCDADVAEQRESARGDRIAGMARKQADAVHDGVHYDLELDTGARSPQDCARTIATRLVASPDGPVTQ
jgi:chloramphenicol 3-O phosphotransferase